VLKELEAVRLLSHNVLRLAAAWPEYCVWRMSEATGVFER